MKYIVTGTSSGLGFEIAKRLVDLGSVIGLSRTIGKASILLEKKNFEWFCIDFSSPFEQISPVIESSLMPVLSSEEYTLVINAAQFYLGESRLTSLETQQLFQTNLFSVMSLVNRMIGPKLKRVLFINSISGLIGQSGQHEYSASKHALKGFSSSLAKQAKDMHFDVMSVNPGGIRTELWDGNAKIATDDFIEPDNLADILVSLLKVKQRIFVDSFVILPPSDV